jgi:hypothetical protein
MAKVKHEDAAVFVFFPLTNRERPGSTLSSAGVSFPSLDAAIGFLGKKPADVTFSLTAPGASLKDAKFFLELSEAEVSAFNKAAAAASSMQDFPAIPSFEGYVSLRSLVASRVAETKGGVEGWYKLGRSKGVVLTKVVSEQSTLYVFFQGTNHGVLSAGQVRRSEVFDSLESAVKFVHEKPAGVGLYFATGGLSDRLNRSAAISPGDVTSKFSDFEVTAFEAALNTKTDRP